MNSKNITIELIGSHIARHVEGGATVDMTRLRNRPATKSAIPPLCRQLLNLGFPPDIRVHIVRKSLSHDRMIPVFNRDRPLGVWADLDCIENERHGPKVVKHRPLPDAVKGKNERTPSSANNPSPEDAREKIASTASGKRKAA
jgi:Fe2+ transport system protein FeoA